MKVIIDEPTRQFPDTIFSMSLNDKILSLMRTNFNLPANEVRSY